MIRLRPEICFKMREARRAAGLSQSSVAAEVGCKQSALSMFEQGDGTKLNDETIGKLAKKFGVSLTAADDVAKDVSHGADVSSTAGVLGFCPNPRCPTNVAYDVGGRVFLLPNRTLADPVGGKFCARCGEVLEKRCPNCGALVHEGAVCSFCGERYVALAGEI